MSLSHRNPARAVVLILIFVVPLGTGVFLPPNAFAYTCENIEEATFVMAYDGGSQILGAANQTDVYARESPMDLSCPYSERHSTAFVMDRYHNKYVETGEWVEPAPGFNHMSEVFWEYGQICPANCQVTVGFTQIACCVWISLRVVNVAGTNKWQYLVDWNRTGNWLQIGPSGGADIGVSRGIPEGETGRRPDNDLTDAYDHHVNLKFASTNCGCSWQSWPGNTVDGSHGGDGGRLLSTYHREFFAADNYLIRHN